MEDTAEVCATGEVAYAAVHLPDLRTSVGGHAIHKERMQAKGKEGRGKSGDGIEKL